VKDESTNLRGIKNRKPDTPPLPRYESLTHWRGIACLLVVIYHSTRGPSQEVGGLATLVFALLGKAWIGVPLFFVISGYCVIASADGLRRKSGPAAHFFWRRFRRIYPPYWAALALTILLTWAVAALLPASYLEALAAPPPWTLTASAWLGNLTLTETWRWHLTGGSESLLLPPAWTLCYEEQFYFLTGFALMLTRRHFFPVLAGLTLIVAVFFVFPQPGWYFQGLFLDGQWLLFAAGVLVYHVSKHVPVRRWIWWSLPLVVGILYVAPDLRQLRQPLNLTYAAGFSYALLLLVLKPWDDRICSLRFLAPLRVCGDMCYSLYLLHWPVVKLVGHAIDSTGVDSPLAILLIRIPACVAATLLLGIVFHRLIERRFWNPRVGSPASEHQTSVSGFASAP